MMKKKTFWFKACLVLLFGSALLLAYIIYIYQHNQNVKKKRGHPVKIQGTVTDSEGQPVEQTTVSATYLLDETYTEPPSVKTDREGNYEIRFRAEGSFKLHVSKSGFRDVTKRILIKYLPAPYRKPLTRNITLRRPARLKGTIRRGEKETIPEVRVVLLKKKKGIERLGFHRKRVSDNVPQGYMPIASAPIRIATEWWDRIKTTKTSGEGTFEFADLEQRSTYKLRAMASNTDRKTTEPFTIHKQTTKKKRITSLKEEHHGNSTMGIRRPGR